MKTIAWAACLISTFSFSTIVTGAGSLYEDAQAVLKTNCAPCHGGSGHAEGNFDYVLSPQKLVSEGLVIPGDPANSSSFSVLGF